MAAQDDTRTQLTLFVPPPCHQSLQALRAVLDPVQASLIDAHVTLCREDELADMDPDALFGRVRTWGFESLDLAFGPPERFHDHGILLPCNGGMERFQDLRQWLLEGKSARMHRAHITLAHPRNPRSSGNTDAALAAIPGSLQIAFSSVALIEQRAGSAWRVLREEQLGGLRAGGRCFSSLP